MKCPKCNYISFDYNQACPKCTRDLSEVRERMNYPSFKPSTLPLPSLTGRAPTESVTLEQDSDFASKETAELQFTGSQDFDFQPESAPGKMTEESDLDFSLDDESDDLTLDFDALAVDGTASEKSSSKQAPTDDSLGLDLDFSLEDETDELSLDLDEPALTDVRSETRQPEQGLEGEESIEASLDMVFGEDDADSAVSQSEEDDKEDTVFLGPNDENEVTEAFDLGDLSVGSAGTEPNENIVDLEDSVSVLDENVELADSDADKGEAQGGEIEIMDLDLDLEKSDDK